MKIAVCLSGIDRCFQVILNELLKNIVIPLNADIFLHTWDSNSIKDRFIKNSNNYDLYEKYCKKFIVEDFNSNWNFLNVNSGKNITPMFYSIYKSFLLIDDNYDVVIRNRMDSLHVNKLQIPKLKNNHVYVGLNATNKSNHTSRNNFILENTGDPFVADNFALGDMESMKIYSNTYLSLNLYKKSDIPECKLANNLIANSISYDWITGEGLYNYMTLIDRNNEEFVFESYYADRKILKLTKQHL